MGTIRKAQEKDADICVQLLYISGPGIYRYSYAFEEQELFEFMKWQFLKKHTLMSKDYAYVDVDTDDQVRGILLGYPIEEMNRVVRAMVRQLGSMLKKAGVRRLIKMMIHMDLNRYFPKTDTDEFFICNLAVHKDYRCQGVGTGLLEKAEALARLSDLTKLSLFVEVDNMRAIKVYEAYGFKATASSLLPNKYQKWGLEGFYKMVKELDHQG